MSEQITIAGKTFTVNPPYASGHILKDNEASTLNQTWMENIRNNFAAKVKEGGEAGLGHHTLQEQLDDYAAKYVFGVRTGGGRTTDPIEKEARRLARERVIHKLKAKNLDPNGFTAAAINEAAVKLLAHEDHGPMIRAEAEDNVDRLRRAASSDISDDFLPTNGHAEEDE